VSRPEAGSAVVLRSAAGSRQARSHAQNEDVWAIHEYPGGALYVVCDGVSTAAAGRYAAEVACARLSQFTEGEGRRDLAALAQLVSEIDWELRGSGRRAMCTLALAWLEERQVHTMSLGDSPIYRLRGSRVKQAGTERTGTFRRLRSYLGMGPTVSEQLQSDSWLAEPGDVLLIASDGLMGAVDEMDLPLIWSRSRAASTMVASLISRAQRSDVDDDATALVVEINAPEPSRTRLILPSDAPEPPWHLSQRSEASPGPKA
jgi:serine/threonine protein phosphatase PrpC